MAKSFAYALTLLAIAFAAATAQDTDEGNPFADDPPPALNINDDNGDDGDSGAAYSDCSCGDCYGSCYADEPWRLLPAGPHGITITGWLAGGGMTPADHPVNRSLAPVGFNDRSEIVANQIYAAIERKVDTSCSYFDIGGRVDILFGTDARFTQAPGLEQEEVGAFPFVRDQRWNAGKSHYHLSVPQMYAEFGWGPISVKAGRWYTAIGYETVTAPDNFFYSHAYTMQFGEPFTHTGVLVNIDINRQNSAFVGVHNGWDNFSGRSDRAGLIYGSSWKNCEETVWVSTAATIGHEAIPTGYTTRMVSSIVAGLQLTCNLEYVVQHDNGFQANALGLGAPAEWYGVNQYLMYTVNDCWKLGGRFEWFRDDAGTRVLGQTGVATPPATGFAGSFYQATLGMNWTPNPNLLMRPEFRWDWFDGTGGNPYSDGTRTEQFVYGFDMILLF